MLLVALYELAYLAQSERQDRQGQDNEPCQRVKSDIVEDAVDARDVDDCYEHYERETYGDVHHLVGEQSELED